MSRKRDYLLVDGYNIIYAWKNLRELAEKSLDSARFRLLEILADYQGCTQLEIIAVFDAHLVSGGLGSIERHGGILVVFTKEAETADIYIERTARTLSGLVGRKASCSPMRPGPVGREASRPPMRPGPVGDEASCSPMRPGPVGRKASSPPMRPGLVGRKASSPPMRPGPDGGEASSPPMRPGLAGREASRPPTRSGPARVRVATSDILEQIIILGQHAQRITAADLEREISEARQALRERYIANRPVKNNQLLELLDGETAEKLEKMRFGKEKD